MAETSVKEPTRGRRLTDSGAVLLGTVLLASGALVALAIPRPVAPAETPSLSLDPAAVAAARELDRANAAAAPTGLLPDQLLDAYYRHGNAEVLGASRHTYQQDRRAITRTVALLRDEHGDEALVAIRAAVAERLDDALSGRMEDDERTAFLGGFETMLATYGLIEDGQWLAPDVVVRALFKARFNAALRQPMTEGLHQVELEAYWGWLAFESLSAAPERRLEALDEYEAVAETEHPEARATLLFHAGRYLEAADVFEEAQAVTGSVRLRNHALAALAEAEVE